MGPCLTHCESETSHPPNTGAPASSESSAACLFINQHSKWKPVSGTDSRSASQRRWGGGWRAWASLDLESQAFNHGSSQEDILL